MSELRIWTVSILQDASKFGVN